MKIMQISRFRIRLIMQFLCYLLCYAIPSTAPAFHWPQNYNLVLDNGLKGAVNYQIIPPNAPAKSVLSEAGWSNFWCIGKKFQDHLDLALLLIGREFQSSDLSINTNADSALLNLLKDENVESLLISGLAAACGGDLGIGNVAFLGSCSMDDANREESAALHSAPWNFDPVTVT